MKKAKKPIVTIDDYIKQQEKDKQIGLYVNMTNDLKDEIKTNNDKTKWWKVGTYAGGGLTLLLLILAF